VPISIRDKYLDPIYWKRVRKEMWQCLKNTYGAYFGVEISHPIGDEAPTVFHPHLNVLWVQRDGYKPFIDVTALRTAWAGILGVELADVHTQYTDNLYQIRHWTNYVSRTFPGYSWWIGPVRWYGSYPVIRKREYICPECGETIRLIGHVSWWDVNEYYTTGIRMGLSPPWERDKDIDPIMHRRKGVIIDGDRGDGHEEGDVGLSELGLYQGRNLADY
jgi:hypothetical protein